VCDPAGVHFGLIVKGPGVASEESLRDSHEVTILNLKLRPGRDGPKVWGFDDSYVLSHGTSRVPPTKFEEVTFGK